MCANVAPMMTDAHRRMARANLARQCVGGMGDILARTFSAGFGARFTPSNPLPGGLLAIDIGAKSAPANAPPGGETTAGRGGHEH